MVEQGTENPCVGGSTPSLATRTRHRLAVAALLVAALAILFLLEPASGLFFEADDYEWLQAARAAADAPRFELPADVNGHFRPAAEGYWLVGWSRFALDAARYHRLTLALHVLAAVIVGWVGLRLVGRRSAGLAAAIVFGLNVAHRSVPTWISAAPDLLLGLGSALAVAGLLERRTRPLGLLGLALALAAKESALALVIVLPLVAPAVRRGGTRLAALLLVTAAAVPHVAAWLLSPYVQTRFGLGWHAPRMYLEAASSLLLPPAAAHPAVPGWLIGHDSPIRVALGVAALVVVLGLASRQIGRARALAWSTAIAVTLLLPSLSTDRIESRWLYLPWVLLAPLAAAAIVAVGDAVAEAVGRRSGVVVATLAIASHGVVHAVGMRADIVRAAERQRLGRASVIGAGIDTPPLADGDVIEVVVPYGAELRGWPVGVALAVARDVEVIPVDDRSGPSGEVPALDATRTPARWR